MKHNYIIFPISLDNSERITNLETVIKSYQGIECTTIAVLNASSTITDEDRARIRNCVDYVLEYHDEPIFSKCVAYNIGLMFVAKQLPARPAIITCVDTDIVIHPTAYDNAITALQDGDDEVYCVIPYNGVAAYCAPHVRNRFIECNHNVDYLTSILPPKWFVGSSNHNCKIQHLHSPGGIAMFDMDTLLNIGGYHSGFRGWGYEDDEIISRMRILGIHVARPNEHLHALWHFDHGEGVKALNPHYHKNHELVSYTESQTVDTIDSNVCAPLRAALDYLPTYTVTI